MKTCLTLILVGLLAGCATKPDWVQEGKTSKDANYDVIQCYDGLLKEYPGFEKLSDEEMRGLMNDCMKKKGYRDKRVEP